MEKVTFATQDDVFIVGDYVDAGKGTPQILLLHMMPSTRASWKTFAEKLKEAGYSSLAIDLRGHGESVDKQSTKIDYQNFTDQEHQDTRKDIDAALAWLKNEKEGSLSHIAVVGASIGANLAIDALARYTELPTAILLSPGLDYRGVMILPAASSLTAGQSFFVVVSQDDEYSSQSAQELYTVATVPKEIRTFTTAGHGTTMLAHEPALVDALIAWLQVHLLAREIILPGATRY